MEKKNFARYMDAWFNAARVRDSFKKENPDKTFEILVDQSMKKIFVCEEDNKSGKMTTLYECTFGSVN